MVTSLRRNCFLCFMRRFWNHVFTCVSLRPSAEASSTRSGVERYLLAKGGLPGIHGTVQAVDSPLRLEPLLQSGELWVREDCARLPPSAVAQGTHSQAECQFGAVAGGEETGTTENAWRVDRGVVLVEVVEETRRSFKFDCRGCLWLLAGFNSIFTMFS